MAFGKNCFDGVKNAGANIAVNDADSAQGKRRE